MRLVLSVCFFFFLFSCNSNKGISKIYTTNSCDKTFQPVNFKDLTDSVHMYNGRFVEISGYYHWTTEASAISFQSADKQLESMIWVDFEPELAKRTGSDTLFLFKPIKEFEKVKEKKIKIRGIVDASNNGHHYVARIENVCYLEILN